VPSWAKIHPVEGGPIPSLFHGTSINYRDDSYVNRHGLRVTDRTAWGCTPRTRFDTRTYVEVDTSYTDLPPVALARIIWSTSDS
jgi:hypothetical protein